MQSWNPQWNDIPQEGTKQEKGLGDEVSTKVNVQDTSKEKPAANQGKGKKPNHLF